MFKSTLHFLPFHHALLNGYGFNTIKVLVNPTPGKLSVIKSGSVKEMPFFCAMECNVRNHTNIWIKLRAGNDDSYRKMIKPSN